MESVEHFEFLRGGARRVPRWGRAVAIGGLLLGAMVASAQQRPQAPVAGSERPYARRTIETVLAAWSPAPTSRVATPRCEEIAGLAENSFDRVNLTGGVCLLEGSEVAAGRTLSTLRRALRPGGSVVVVAPWDEDEHFGGQPPVLAPRAMAPGTLRVVASRGFRVRATEQATIADGRLAYAMWLERL